MTLTTKKQRAANRRNAQHSTGPKTAAGKAVAKFNATTHGLTGQEILFPGDDPEEFQELHDSQLAELNPVGAVETQYAKQFVYAMWRRLSAYRIEAGLYRYLAARNKEKAAWHAYLAIKNRHTELSDMSTFKATPDQQREIDSAYEHYEQTTESASDHTAVLGMLFLNAAESEDILGKLARYSTMHERSASRALHELKKLQVARLRRGDGSILEVPADKSDGDTTTLDNIDR